MMGTNYYLYKEPTCSHCGRSSDPLHIGKSAYGWCFSLHIIPEEGINTYQDWQKLWWKAGAEIRTEYDELLSPEGLEDIITNRSGKETDGPDEQFCAENSAMPGPKGLARNKLDGRHCVGHGEGTWDYITGEFS